MLGVKPGTGQLPWLEEVYITPVPGNVPHDFPSLLRPPHRAQVSIGGKLLAVFILRIAPASIPFGKAAAANAPSGSPRKSDRERKSSRSAPSSSGSAPATSVPSHILSSLPIL